jgi:hypothetical protein
MDFAKAMTPEIWLWQSQKILMRITRKGAKKRQWFEEFALFAPFALSL